MNESNALSATAKQPQEKAMAQLSDTLSRAQDRLGSSIHRYRTMNDVMVGPVPQMADEASATDSSSGMIYGIIEIADRLNNMIAALDAENDRYNTVVND